VRAFVDHAVAGLRRLDALARGARDVQASPPMA
jgi:hypothetical protein